MVTFYKDYKYLKYTSSEASLFIGKVDKSMSGKYKCTKTGRLLNVDKESHDEEDISFADLFSTPELVINPNPIQAGSNMILTCVARLHPLRASTELQFAFYKDGWHVQGFSPSNNFTIPSVKTEDSGDYSCEIRTPTNSINKMSKLSSIQVQVDEKPVVTFDPNWDKILRTERITLSCEGSANAGYMDYTWYKNNNVMMIRRKSFDVFSADDGDIGNYQCQAGTGEKSEPVHLDVFFVWLILQAPNSIHEGDTVTLSCRMWRSGKAQNTTFYKDDKMIKFLDNLYNLDLGTVTISTSGKYKCTRFINTGAVEKLYTAEESISVAELFSPPELRVSPYSMIEGADMTQTCHTVLSPLRRNTELLFEFYKNGKTVQAMSSSDKYKVQSVQPEDSGNYACKAQNKQGSVSKLSNSESVQIQGMASVAFTPNVGKIFSGQSMTFTCNVDSNMKGNQNFNWYRDSIKLKETQHGFTIKSASVNDSGYYQCQSSVTHLSEAIRLDVSNGDLILQTPPIINEGDDLILQCQHRTGLPFPLGASFYKEGTITKVVDNGSSLQLGKASKKMNGSYRCTKKSTKGNYQTNLYVAEAFVSVTDTFPYLQLRASRDLVIEGDPVVLSCDTALNSALSPLRGKTELRFAFYKDGKNIVAFGTSDTYLISSAEKQQSGNYTCEVKSSTNGVTKMSPAFSVDVEDLFSSPILNTNSNPYLQGRISYLSCDTTAHPKRLKSELKYSFYKNEKSIQKLSPSSIYRMTISGGDTGNYTCEVTYSTFNVVKKSNIKNIQVQAPLSGIKMTMDKGEQEIQSGASMSFRCSVERGSAISITWFHNSKEVDKNCILYEIRQDGKLLLINSVQPHHSGSYQCKATNDASSLTSTSIAISVIDPIRDVTLTIDKDVLETRSGETLTFSCVAAKNSTSTFVWLHNGVKLNEISETHEVRDYGKLLYIKSLDAHHGGQYQCLTVQYISTKELKFHSNIINIHVSEKASAHLVPSLIAVVLVVLAILTSIVVYKYRHRITMSKFALQPKNIRVSKEQDEDYLLYMDNMDNMQRISNSHH
ncbi:Fc receptor-like protein 5 isoform X2 [Hyperolius riggenbachi]